MATVEHVERIDAEATSYIVTYVIPFLALPSDTWEHGVALVILYLVLCILYVTTNMVHINPMLNLLGFHLYQITEAGNEYALIARRRVRRGAYIKVSKLVVRFYWEKGQMTRLRTQAAAKDTFSEVLNLDLADAAPTVCLASSPVESLPEYQRLSMTDAVRQEFENVVRNVRSGFDAEDVIFREYDAGSKPDAHEIEYLALAEADFVADQFTAFSDGRRHYEQTCDLLGFGGQERGGQADLVQVSRGVGRKAQSVTMLGHLSLIVKGLI